MRVSIITPVYNCAEFLAETVTSVMKQSFGDWELILVDDCSTDNSVAVAHRFVENDRRIRLLRLSVNSGTAVARNAGIEVASGRFIAFVDSDDIWLPEKLDRQISFMESNNYAFSHTQYERISERGERIGLQVTPPRKMSYRDMLKSNRIGCLTAIYDSAKLGKLYMPLLRKRQDYGLWLRILKQEPFVYCVPQVLARYRLRANSISRNKLQLLRYNWSLFRTVENLSVCQSAYYVGWNVVRRILGK